WRQSTVAIGKRQDLTPRLADPAPCALPLTPRFLNKCVNTRPDPALVHDPALVQDLTPRFQHQAKGKT
ncbi:MAG: hypothetical protein U1C54_02540, partial [Xanthomonadaceae bacterium]|nr:hypothetical protein [Xanthomonadaceae bacterium]